MKTCLFTVAFLLISPLILAASNDINQVESKAANKKVKSWEEVIQLPKYLQYPNEKKLELIGEYFNEVILPNANAESFEEIDKLRAEFAEQAYSLDPDLHNFVMSLRASAQKAAPVQKEEQLKFYKCVLDKMEEQQSPNVLGIAIKYCEILHPDADGY